MITITVLGLDEYVVGHYSKEHTSNLAALFEVEPEEINFFSASGFVIHDGTEQTSWNTIVRVNAPEKYEMIEEKVARYLIETMRSFSIHLDIEFYYFHSHHQHSYINKEYPRYICDDNTVSVESEELGEDDELYEGNIFEGMEEKLEEAAHHHCDCGDDCDCHKH